MPQSVAADPRFDPDSGGYSSESSTESTVSESKMQDRQEMQTARVPAMMGKARDGQTLRFLLGRTYAATHVCMCVCLSVCLSGWLAVCLSVCLYVCMYVCMYVCV